jgi:tetratricopeptide (TPR) repeat protein
VHTGYSISEVKKVKFYLRELIPFLHFLLKIQIGKLFLIRTLSNGELVIMTRQKTLVTLNGKAVANAHTETLLIDINDVTTTSASIVIAWDKLKVVIPFTVETDKTAQANIDAAIAEGKDLDKVYASAANYYFNAKQDYDKALEYVNLSIGVKQTHNNTFLKARILYAKGDTKEAIKLAEEAKKMAETAEDKRWTEYIGETLDEWKKK